MTYTTDERLRGFLDTNQLARERLCLGLLSVDKRFSNVRPRHPRGGPDSGGDIDANYLGTNSTIGAVGFVNQANDSSEQKRKVSTKFKNDLTSALKSNGGLYGFVFFTNVNLSLGEKQALEEWVRTKGIGHVEIYDRERMRIALDGSDGLSLRFQILNIPLSDAEQATFFARWGDDIQAVIAQGFSEVHASLKRMQFLHEATRPLEDFTVSLELDREYDAKEIGHFRAFCSTFLIEPCAGLARFESGIADNVTRLDAKDVQDIDTSQDGIGKGMCGAQWVVRLPNEQDGDNFDAMMREDGHLERGRNFTSVGALKVRAIPITFSQSNFFRLPPYLRMADLDQCRFALFLNKGLATKVRRIHCYANEYKLGEFEQSSLSMDAPNDGLSVSMMFRDDELVDPWVRVMHKMSAFTVSFSETTPTRLFQAAETIDSLAPQRAPEKMRT